MLYAKGNSKFWNVPPLNDLSASNVLNFKASSSVCPIAHATEVQVRIGYFSQLFSFTKLGEEISEESIHVNIELSFKCMKVIKNLVVLLNMKIYLCIPGRI